LGGLHELRHLLREKLNLRVALLQLLLQLGGQFFFEKN
jgi:hypothetical protein